MSRYKGLIRYPEGVRSDEHLADFKYCHVMIKVSLIAFFCR